MSNFFPTKRSIPKIIWDNATRYSKDHFYPEEKGFSCFTQFDSDKKITEEEVKIYKDFNVTNTAEIETCLKKVSFIDPDNKICSCYDFLRENYCEHLAGYFLAYGIEDIPKKLVVKVKPGRKTDATTNSDKDEPAKDTDNTKPTKIRKAPGESKTDDRSQSCKPKLKKTKRGL